MKFLSLTVILKSFKMAENWVMGVFLNNVSVGIFILKYEISLKFSPHTSTLNFFLKKIDFFLNQSSQNSQNSISRSLVFRVGPSVALVSVSVKKSISSAQKLSYGWSEKSQILDCDYFGTLDSEIWLKTCGKKLESLIYCCEQL